MDEQTDGRTERQVVSPLDACRVHGAKRCLTLVLLDRQTDRQTEGGFDQQSRQTHLFVYRVGISCSANFLFPPLADLSVASLHVSQRHLGVDRMAAGHAEDLQVGVIAVAFSHLDRETDGSVRQTGG